MAIVFLDSWSGTTEIYRYTWHTSVFHTQCREAQIHTGTYVSINIERDNIYTGTVYCIKYICFYFQIWNFVWTKFSDLLIYIFTVTYNCHSTYFSFNYIAGMCKKGWFDLKRNINTVCSSLWWITLFIEWLLFRCFVIILEFLVFFRCSVVAFI